MSQPTEPDLAAAPGDDPGTVGRAGGDDPLAGVLAELDAVDDLPLEQRAAAFERMHATITDTLGRTADPAATSGTPRATAVTGGGTR